MAEPEPQTIAELFEEYKMAEAYDYPRGQVTPEGFAKYLEKRLGHIALEGENGEDQLRLW